MKRDAGLVRAIKAVGNMSRLAIAIGVVYRTVVVWKQVPAKWVLEVEKATGVPRHELRPDLFAGYRRVIEEPKQYVRGQVLRR